MATSTMQTVISCIINTVYSVLQWNPGPARRNPTKSLSQRLVDGFMAVILQEASDHMPLHLGPIHRVHRSTRTSPILLDRGRFLSPTLRSTPFTKLSTSKVHAGAWLHSWYVDFCDAHCPFNSVLPQSRFALSTSTMLWPRSAMLSTAELLRTEHTRTHGSARRRLHRWRLPQRECLLFCW